MTTTRLIAATLAAGFALAPAAHASDATDAILAECARTGTVGTGHSQADLRDALANLPMDVAEYTDCPRQIRLAMSRSALKLSEGSSTSELTEVSKAGGGAPLGTDGSGAAAAPVPSGDGGDGDASDELATTPEPDGTSPLASEPAAERVDDEPHAQNAAFAQPAGSIAAAAVVGFSLLALARPGMLARRHDEEE